MSNPCCVYDITIPATKTTQTDLTALFNKVCKSWAFQLERGEKTDYEHYQCRVSFKERYRLKQAIETIGIKEAHLSVTSSENRDNNFYTTKETSRIAGPWTDKDPYIPRQVRDIKLWPWQQYIVSTKDCWDTRTINIIIDETGNIGKTTLSTYISVHKIGRAIPALNDFRDIMRIVMNTDKVRLYIFDIPKSIPKKYLGQLYAGIEKIKDGYCFDDRYSFKEEYFDCPNVWIFTNEKPNTQWLSKDRWVYWTVKGKSLARTSGA